MGSSVTLSEVLGSLETWLQVAPSVGSCTLSCGLLVGTCKPQTAKCL